MSDGIRSGVNWMRENFRSTTRASVWMSSVLASPGTPTIRLLPPTKSVSSTCCSTSSWPTMSFFSSWRMRAWPWFIRSASAMSSGALRSTCMLAASTNPPVPRASSLPARSSCPSRRARTRPRVSVSCRTRCSSRRTCRPRSRGRSAPSRCPRTPSTRRGRCCSWRRPAGAWSGRCPRRCRRRSASGRRRARRTVAGSISKKAWKTGCVAVELHEALRRQHPPHLLPRSCTSAPGGSRRR